MTIVISNLVKKYGDIVVIDHLNLTVAEGEFITLLGPSGCGKTTTLRAIAGLVEIDDGTIIIDGQLMNDIPPHKRSTSMVFQSYALFPHMTVFENVAFGLRMRGFRKPEIKERVFDVLQMMGLEKLSDRKPGQLSGGQQQRVAVARAIVTRPRVLLFDEPLSNLDQKLRERLRIDIRELQRELKITTIYVTHDQTEAMVISDRIAVMNNGKIIQFADPPTLYSHPANSFVADFIGQANIFSGYLLHISQEGCEIETPIGKLISSDQPDSSKSDIMVCWRPEDMTIFPNGQENVMTGKVEKKIYLGNLTDLFVNVNGVSVKVQVGGLVDVQPGESIVMGLAANRVRVIDRNI